MKRIKKLKALPLCLKGFLAAFTLHRIRSMLILFGIIFSINDVCNGLLMDLISTTLTLGIEPYQELSSVRKEMCISRCHYQPRKCLSLSLEGSPERLVCRFYNATFDVGPMVKHTGTQPFLFYSKRTVKKDCLDWSHSGARLSGNYEIRATPSSVPVTVLCDMEYDGGGWIVFMKMNGRNGDMWSKDWNSYKNGFTTDNGFWVGNEFLHQLTESTETLQELVLHGNQHEGNYVSCGSFAVLGEDMNYQILVDEGPCRQHIQPIHGRNFSTVDRGVYCPEGRNGAGWWWTYNCIHSNVMTFDRHQDNHNSIILIRRL